MPGKRHVSVRFQEISKGGRMSSGEWEEFKRLANYFNISDDLLVEYSLKYEKSRQKTNDPHQHTEQSHVPSEELRVNFPMLKCLFPSLSSGVLDKKVIFSRGESYFVVPPGVEVHYYKPFLLSFEVSYQIRLTLDLTQPFTVSCEGNTVTIVV
ncbi:MAG: hypothetical protein ACOX1J_03690 [Dethiobacteria bacterium]|jgi:hypothetical protein